MRPSNLTQPPPHTHISSSLFIQLQMAQRGVPGSFNPHAIHPFTNNNVVDSYKSPPPPSQYPRPIPSSTTQYTISSPSSVQSSRQPSPSGTVHSPQPRRAVPPVNAQQSFNAAQPKPIFFPFHQDRSSPELEEILLRKKLTRTLGPVALGLDVKRGVYPSS